MRCLSPPSTAFAHALAGGSTLSWEPDALLMEKEIRDSCFAKNETSPSRLGLYDKDKTMNEAAPKVKKMLR